MRKFQEGDKVKLIRHDYVGIEDTGVVIQYRDKGSRQCIVMIKDSTYGEKYTLNFKEEWMEKIEEVRLRVVHYPQIPCDPFYVDVKDLEDANRIMSLLAHYDLFQFHENIKPDYSNVTVLEQWDEEEGDWVDWSDEETGIDDLEDYLRFVRECEEDEE